MTSTGQEQQTGGLMSHLGQAAKDYAKARGADAVKKVAGKLGDVTESMNDKADNGGFKGPAISTALKKVGEGQSPVKAAASGVATGIKEKVKSAFGRSGRSQKFMNIVEDVFVGVPVDVAYNQWTQFQEFASFMKGVDSVDQTDETESSWKVKVFKSRRTWKATVTEQIPDRKVAWSTDGPKGTTKGVVTFHPLADDLTQVLLVIEYYPQGFFEKTGNLWRAAGRRARLDLKNYRRFIMMRGEETGSWRGEIRDSEVVAEPGEAEGREGRREEQAQAEGQEEQGQYEEYDEEPEDEGEEDYEEEPEDEGEEEYEEQPEDEGEEEYEEQGEEETAPAGNGRPRRARQPARASQEQDEDDEEDEDYEGDDEGDDEEPEERPRTRSRRREPAEAGRR